MNNTNLDELIKKAKNMDPKQEDLKILEYVIDNMPAADFGEGVCLGYMLAKLIIKQS